MLTSKDIQKSEKLTEEYGTGRDRSDMTTGKIEYSPDYESQRPSLNVIFEQGMERQRIVAEHQRLKDAVVDAVRKEGRKGMLTPCIESARTALVEFEKREVQS